MQNRSYNILLVGETTAGKTCLLNRMIENYYDPFVMVTRGASFVSKKFIFNTRTIKVDFWDLGGNEKFRTLNKFYHKNGDVVLLVYNITVRSSFEEIKNYHYQNSKTLAKDASMIITSLFFSIYLSWKCM